MTGSEEERSRYDAAYRDFRQEHLKFLELARAALEVVASAMRAAPYR